MAMSNAPKSADIAASVSQHQAQTKGALSQKNSPWTVATIGGAPVRYLSWCVYKSNFTRVDEWGLYRTIFHGDYKPTYNWGTTLYEYHKPKFRYKWPFSMWTSGGCHSSFVECSSFGGGWSPYLRYKIHGLWSHLWWYTTPKQHIYIYHIQYIYIYPIQYLYNPNVSRCKHHVFYFEDSSFQSVALAK